MITDKTADETVVTSADQCYMCQAKAGSLDPGRVRTFECTSARRHIYLCCSGKCTKKFEIFCERKITQEGGKQSKRKADIAKNQGKSNCPLCYFTMKPLHADLDDTEDEGGDGEVSRPRRGGRAWDEEEEQEPEDELGKRSDDPEVAAVELRLEEASAPGGQDLLEESVAAGEALKAAGRAGERTRNLLIRCRRMLAEVQQKQALFGKNEKEVDPEILAEAKEIVDDHDEEIAELEQELRELEAAGTKDKKAKKAKEKEIREMKSDPGYMAAQRMLKDPVKELAAREKLAEERARVEVQMSNMKNANMEALRKILGRAREVGVSKKNHDFARLDDDLAKLMAEKQAERARENEAARARIDEEKRKVEARRKEDERAAEERRKRAEANGTALMLEGDSVPNAPAPPAPPVTSTPSTSADSWADIRDSLGGGPPSTRAGGYPAVNGSAQTPPKTLGEWDDNSKWEDKQWRGCEESSTVASSSPAPSPAPTGTLSSAAANVNQGASQFLNRALNAAPPPAPLPPPPAPKVWCSYVWDKEMVAQFTATSKADLETLCTPHTIEFQGMEVQLHVADDKATMNAFFTPNPSPSQAECEALAKLLEVRLTKWAPPVPKPTGPPPEPPEAGDQLWRCANAYECQHASQLKCSIGQLVKECGPQANGWLHVKTASGTEGYVASTCFVKEGRTAQAYSAVAAPAPGYLPLSRGDRLVVTYVDGAWLYGYRGQETAETREEQKGWFPRYCTIYGLHH